MVGGSNGDDSASLCRTDDGSESRTTYRMGWGCGRWWEVVGGEVVRQAGGSRIAPTQYSDRGSTGGKRSEESMPWKVLYMSVLSRGEVPSYEVEK